ncbi:MAG: hypothetical protein ACTTH6_00740 [Candidatus Altimarinota bacterium]
MLIRSSFSCIQGRLSAFLSSPPQRVPVLLHLGFCTIQTFLLLVVRGSQYRS